MVLLGNLQRILLQNLLEKPGRFSFFGEISVKKQTRVFYDKKTICYDKNANSHEISLVFLKNMWYNDYAWGECPLVCNSLEGTTYNFY